MLAGLLLLLEGSPSPRDQAITFLAGRIGASAAVRMSLTRRGTNLTGTYYYLKYNSTIGLSGTIDAKQDIHLTEWATGASFAGRFTSAGTFSGTWTSADKKRALAFELIAAPVAAVTPRPEDVTEVPREMFVEAYGKQVAGHLGYDHLEFSPDGRTLAFTLSGITIGDSEQVWTYDIGRHTLRRITELVTKHEIGLKIRSLAWDADNTLRVSLHRIDWKDQSNNKDFCLVVRGDEVTTAAASVRPMYPFERSIPSPSDRFEVRFRTPGTSLVVDVSTNRTLFETAQYWDRVQWVSEERFLLSYSLGHGKVIMKSGVVDKQTGKVDVQLMNDGGGDVDQFQVDAKGLQAAWPLDRPFSVLVYDLVRDIPVKQVFVGAGETKRKAHGA